MLVVALHCAVAAPQAQGEQPRVSTTPVEKVCLSGKPAGQVASPAAHTHSPARKGGSDFASQTSPAPHPTPIPPPTHAMPVRAYLGGGTVFMPPAGVHAPAVPIGGVAETLLVPAGSPKPRHCPLSPCVIVPWLLWQAVSEATSIAPGMQVAVFGLQAHVLHIAGSTIRSPCHVYASVGCEGGHEGAAAGSPS
jgi:hypothetical protein